LINLNKKELFLHGLEDWISEVVKNKSNGHNDAIPPMIREGFDCSMQANIDYHKAVADTFSENGDRKLVTYHTLMSNVYSALLIDSNAV
jgi:hypothetical protein